MTDIARPRLVVEVALDATHLDDPTGITYTDLSDRVRGWRWSAGRSDQLGKFGTASVIVDLDNIDRALDPLNTSGLVPVATSKGLPLSPARVSFTYKGTSYPVIGRGFLGPEGWPVTRSAHGTESTVSLTVLDATGAQAWVDMAASPWLALVAALDPDWWLPGEVVAPEDTGDGYLVPNRAGSGGFAVTYSAGVRTVTDAVTAVDYSLTSATADFRFDDVGRTVEGDGIDTGTVISEVLSATEVVLSMPTTAAATDVTVTFGSIVPEPISPDNPLTTLDTTGNGAQDLGSDRPYSVAATSSMGIKPFVRLVSPEADVFPDGDLDAYTVSLMWRAANYDNGSLAGIGQAEIFTVTSAGSRRLRCWIDGDDGGAMKLTVYDGAGAALTTLTAPDPATHGSSSYGENYDDLNPHGIVVRVVGGTSVSFFVDGGSVTETTTVPTDAYAGDVTLGEVPTGVYPRALFDELLVFHRALSDNDCGRLATAPNLDKTWGRGDTPAERLAYYYASAQWYTLADELDQVMPPPASIVDPDPEVTLAGVEEVGSWPSTLGGAVVQVADGIAGDVYAIRDGRVRVRSVLALTDPDLAAVFATPSANFTDAPSPDPSPQPLRRGPLKLTGTRLDRVITAVKIEHTSVPAGSVSSVPIDAVFMLERASRFGRREASWRLATESRLVPPALAEVVLDRYELPPVELQAVDLSPHLEGADAGALMDWLVANLDLEVPVMATDTPPTGDPVVFDLLHVQGWTWSAGEGVDMSVSLNLAKS